MPRVARMARPRIALCGAAEWVLRTGARLDGCDLSLASPCGDDMGPVAALLRTQGQARGVWARPFPAALFGASAIVVGEPGAGGAPASPAHAIRAIEAVTRGMRDTSIEAPLLVAIEPPTLLLMVAREVLGSRGVTVVAAGAAVEGRRLAFAMSRVLEVNPRQVNALALGGPGSDLVVPRDGCRVAGIPAADLGAEERLANLLHPLRRAKPASPRELSEWAATACRDLLAPGRRIACWHVAAQGLHGIDGFVTIPALVGDGALHEPWNVGLAPETVERLRRSAHAQADRARAFNVG